MKPMRFRRGSPVVGRLFACPALYALAIILIAILGALIGGKPHLIAMPRPFTGSP